MTLALDFTEYCIKPLPVRYNFPNQIEFDEFYPDELREARFIHFLRDKVVSREKDFEDEAAITNFIGRKDLTGSNELLRSRVEALHLSAAT
jgi:hypothetical protein